jgi:hypothetical protein
MKTRRDRHRLAEHRHTIAMTASAPVAVDQQNSNGEHYYEKDDVG